MKNNAEDHDLSAPKPDVKRLSKTVIAIICGVIIALGLVLLNGISQESPKAEPEKKSEELPAQNKTKPLTGEQPEASGLATASVPLLSKPDIPPISAPSIQRNAESLNVQALRAEYAQVRLMKAQLELQALQAPISVSLGSGVAAISTKKNYQPLERTKPFQPSNQATNASNDMGAAAKEEFVNVRSMAASSWQSPYTREAGLSYEIKTGTVIPGIMITGINSDLPGRLIAQVSQHVYDTATGSALLIPQGSRLFGIYDSRVAMGQSRVLIAWNRIIFPDGSSVTLESMPGSDQAGYSGFEDQVDNHYLKIFGSSIIMSLISGGMAYSVDALDNSNSSDDNPSLRDEMGTALSSQLGQASLQLLQKYINIQPTLEIRPGYRFNLILVKDLAFDAPYKPMRR